MLALKAALASWVLFTWAAAASAADGLPDEKAFAARLVELESRVSSEAPLPERLAALGEYARYLDGLEAALARKKGSEHRELRGSVIRLGLFLDEIPLKDFALSSCGAYRGSILFAVSPREEYPSYVPGEATEALKILSLLCKNPELAKIPEAPDGEE